MRGKSGAPNFCREPILIDAEMRIGGGKERRLDAERLAAREKIADDLVGFDRAAFLQIAIHG